MHLLKVLFVLAGLLEIYKFDKFEELCIIERTKININSVDNSKNALFYSNHFLYREKYYLFYLLTMFHSKFKINLLRFETEETKRDEK